ncbi:MAG TPA: cupredoxin family copper-binding protein [Candidatus Limnocylindrales bacterium]|nr:cupredoxin family copper-binding protein [Candidatus Limnocylindrales bacterium]
MNQKKIVIAVIVVGLLFVGGLVFAGAQSGQKSETQQTSANQEVATKDVEIKGYAFTPAAIKVKVGDTVTWTNQDSVEHNVIATKADPAAPNGPLIGKGETYSFTFTKAGTYEYYCSPHPHMKGTIVVES